MARRCFVAFILPLLLGLNVASGQDASYKVEPLKEAAPSELSVAIRGELADVGYRILDSKGKPYLDIWLRKSVPTSKAPAGAEGAVQFPFLRVGELLGAARFAAQGHDARDQTVVTGAYTIRYGLQPVNGDHLGVSLYRDFALLLPAKVDNAVAPVEQEKLFDESAQVSGTEHPAVYMLYPTKEGAKEAALHHDDQKNFWGVVLPLPLHVEGKNEGQSKAIELVFDGVAES